MIKMTRAALIIIFSVPWIAQPQSIVNSVHNLSAGGPGTVKASSESEICIFCHTPHNSSPRKPLWNRPDPGYHYIPYNSSTLQASPGQPTGTSILCLSCHDGTIALGNVLSRPAAIDFSGGISGMPTGTSNLTQDLTDDHPVSFIYNSLLASSDGELVDPVSLTGPVSLPNEQLQCTTCHDPHKNLFGNFLVATPQYSGLCLYCHQKNFWNQTSHKISTATWNGSGSNPWPRLQYSTVAENGCENCHTPHNAGGAHRLLNQPAEESNCLVCHDGNVAEKDIQSEFTKPYIHDIYATMGVHDPGENNTVQTAHVECEDCHNPHASNSTSAGAPDANGYIDGVKGVDAGGSPVVIIRYQYELCFRCHGDSPVKPASSTTRQIEQNNVRLEFDPANPSYHPLEAPGKNSDVPSLISPYSEASVIYCTDCHSSDGTNSPAGPHGSIYAHILKYNYATTDNTPESYQSYELCYRCHDRDAIINRVGSFGRRVHRTHIVNENTPCSICHDAHGISSAQGSSTSNTHLINFDIATVYPDPVSGRLEFVDLGNVSGRCYLNCHGRDHSPEFYQN